jgi:hypothetical protein
MIGLAKSKDIKELKESEGKHGKHERKQEGSKETVEEAVLRMLGEQKPWNLITKECHVSTKTVQKIRDGTYRVSSDPVPNITKPIPTFNEHPQLQTSNGGTENDLGRRWEGKTSGEIAAAAFKLFQKDAQPFEVVKHLRLPVGLVKKLYQDYKDMLSHSTSSCRTCYDNGYGEGHDEGYNEGYDEAKAIQLWYFCSICGGTIYIEPNGDSHTAMLRYMHEHGWGHAKCHEKKGDT